MKFNKAAFEKEFRFRTSRSSGAGGQHVNTTETKVELSFNIGQSTALSDEEKRRFSKKWKNRITAEGDFSIASAKHRSQSANKELVVRTFFKMLETGLHEEKMRIATKMPKGVKEAMLKNKKVQSERKHDRSKRTRDYLN